MKAQKSASFLKQRRPARGSRKRLLLVQPDPQTPSPTVMSAKAAIHALLS
jgi:hypothetical protein